MDKPKPEILMSPSSFISISDFEDYCFGVIFTKFHYGKLLLMMVLLVRAE